jgi:pimeloyl-ACP methyl ester carboxylesterase
VWDAPPVSREFQYRILNLVQLLHEVMGHYGLNTPQRSIALTGHSVGSLIAKVYCMWVSARGINGPQIKHLHLLGILGQLVRPFLPKRDAQVSFWQIAMGSIHPNVTHLFNFGMSEVQHNFDIMFHQLKIKADVESPDRDLEAWRQETLKQWIEVHRRWWCPTKTRLTWEASRATTYQARLELTLLTLAAWRMSIAKRLLREFGLWRTERSPSTHQIRDIVMSQLRNTGAEINVLIPEYDAVISPQSQFEVGHIMRGYLPERVEIKTIRGGHAVQIENPAAYVQAITGHST